MKGNYVDSTEAQSLTPQEQPTVLVGRKRGKQRGTRLNVRLDDQLLDAMESFMAEREHATGKSLSRSDVVRLALADLLGVEGLKDAPRVHPTLPLSKGGSSTKKR